MAFRFLNPAPVFYDTLGTTPAALGSLETYEDEACTTPYATFNSSDLDVENPVVIPLGSDGRASVEIWSSDPFFARLLDADDNVVWTREINSGIPAGLTLPELDVGEYLTGDGVGGYAGETPWALPDPTGSPGDAVVVNPDGTGFILQAFPDDPEAPADPEITVGAASFQAGISTDETKFLVQYGADSAPATGLVNTNKSVTFATAYSVAPKVMVIPSSDSNAGGPMVPELTSVSTTGFTVLFTIAAGSLSSAVTLNAVPFDWVALGNVEVPA
jgi:hypothetical protein